MNSSEMSWQIGDLVWARLGRNPIWPGIITEDPDTKTSKRVKANGPRLETQTFHHVTFLGDNLKRSWVTSRNCFKYASVEPQDQQFKNSVVLKRFKERWELGIQEADSMINKSRTERLTELRKMPQALASKRKREEEVKTEHNSIENGHPAPKKRKMESANIASKEMNSTNVSQKSKRTKIEVSGSETTTKVNGEKAAVSIKIEVNDKQVKEEVEENVKTTSAPEPPSVGFPKAAKEAKNKAESMHKNLDSGSAVGKPVASVTSIEKSVKQQPEPQKDAPISNSVPSSSKGTGKDTVQLKKSPASKRVLFKLAVNKDDVAAAGSSKDFNKPAASKKEVTAANPEEVLRSHALVAAARRRTRKYGAGDLCWARSGNYPYWPCMLAKDPDTGSVRQDRDGRIITSPSPLLHVRYYADNGRRNWVHANHVIPFEGVQAFKELGKTVSSKDRKERKAFHITDRYRKRWNEAVQQAMSFLPKTSMERQKYFEENFPYDENPKRSGKKKAKEDKAMPKSKKSSAVATKRKSLTSVNSAEERQKKAPRKVKKNLTPIQLAACFQVFKSHTILTAKKQYPLNTDEEIELILQTMWQNKTPEAKSLYAELAPEPGPNNRCFKCDMRYRTQNTLIRHNCPQELPFTLPLVIQQSSSSLGR